MNPKVTYHVQVLEFLQTHTYTTIVVNLSKLKDLITYQ